MRLGGTFAANKLHLRESIHLDYIHSHNPPTRHNGIEARDNTRQTTLQWLQTNNKITTEHSPINGDNSLRPSTNPLPNLRRRTPLLRINRLVKPHNKRQPPTTKPLHHPRARNPPLLPNPNTPLPAPLPLHPPPPTLTPRPPPPRHNLRRRRDPPRQRKQQTPHRNPRLEPQNPAAKRHGDGAVRRQEEPHAARRGRGVWTEAKEFCDGVAGQSL